MSRDTQLLSSIAQSSLRIAGIDIDISKISRNTQLLLIIAQTMSDIADIGAGGDSSEIIRRIEVLEDEVNRLLNEGGAGIQVQADWEVDDPDSVRYIRNRPQVNNIILRGNRLLPEIPITNLEIEELLNSQVI